MPTVAEIKAAIAKLTPDELRELAAWFDEHQRLLASSESLFGMYDREERECQSRVAEKSG